MAKLTVIYARSATLGGVLIRARDPFGKWSHCAVMTDDHSVIEAESLKGVVETPLGDFLARYPGQTQREFVEVECPDPSAGIAWARTQVGKGYDYLAIFGLLTRGSWQSDGRWMCSELAERTLIESGRSRFRDFPHHISPNLSWMTL